MEYVYALVRTSAPECDCSDDYASFSGFLFVLEARLLPVPVRTLHVHPSWAYRFTTERSLRFTSSPSPTVTAAGVSHKGLAASFGLALLACLLARSLARLLGSLFLALRSLAMPARQKSGQSLISQHGERRPPSEGGRRGSFSCRPRSGRSKRSPPTSPSPSSSSQPLPSIPVSGSRGHREDFS